MCQHRTASLRAVATTAMCMPRRALMRSKNARSGPGVFDAAQAASTSIPRACARPCLVIRPWEAGCPPDCLTRGVEAEAADEALRGAEATEVADRGDDRQRDDRIDARHLHQAPHV